MEAKRPQNTRASLRDASIYIFVRRTPPIGVGTSRETLKVFLLSKASRVGQERRRGFALTPRQRWKKEGTLGWGCMRLRKREQKLVPHDGQAAAEAAEKREREGRAAAIE